MNGTTAPAQNIGLGDRNGLLPGFVMEVQGVATCETDGSRSQEHAKFKVTDPEGNEDWLCAYDVHKAGAS